MRRARARPPTWCWSASAMPPICRRRTRRSGRSRAMARQRLPVPLLRRASHRLSRIAACHARAGGAASRAGSSRLRAAEAGHLLRSFDDVIAKARAERDRVLALRAGAARAAGPLRARADRDRADARGRAGAAAAARAGSESLDRRALDGRRQQRGGGSATAHEARKRSEASLLDEARADPLVQKVLQRFPGAEIVSVRERSIDATAEPDAPATAGYDPEDESGGGPGCATSWA